jgi:hypothetical protein
MRGLRRVGWQFRLGRHLQKAIGVLHAPRAFQRKDSQACIVAFIDSTHFKNAFRANRKAIVL